MSHNIEYALTTFPIYNPLSDLGREKLADYAERDWIFRRSRFLIILHLSFAFENLILILVSTTPSTITHQDERLYSLVVSVTNGL